MFAAWWFMTRIVQSVFVVITLVLFTGCQQDSIKKQPINGEVSFQGKPIKFGTIRFEPVSGQPVGSSGDIRDGKFSIDRNAGPAPGKYKVWVQAFDRMSEAGAMPGQEGPPPKDILPKKYLENAAEEVDIKEVSDSQPNTLKLDLK
jgi:hypothetical protein